MFNKISRLYHTIKYLRVQQVFWRGINLLPRLVNQKRTHPVVIQECPNNYYIFRKGITQDYKTFTFLCESYNIKQVGWDNSSISKLWRYNLHYFEFLIQEKASSEQIFSQYNIIENWLENNSYGKGTGWEPYPTSLRIINWIKWHWNTSQLSEKAKLSLWNQVRWLAFRPEYHLLGNHLFINAKALLYASVFFSLDSSSNIYKIGNSILKKELDEQFLLDGAHFELSPMYHSLAMEDLLDLISISEKLPSSFSKQKIIEKYKKGMAWLETFVYNNNELAHFNDCANRIAPTYTELESYAAKLGVKKNEPCSSKFLYHEKSGFIVFKDEKSHLIADVGIIGPDFLPGHAHADTLSFELAIKGQRVIVNSGTSVYGVSRERLRQRGTAAHSTVQIDDNDSSEVWSGFRVARRAKPFNVELNSKFELNSIIRFSASHDGYKKLINAPIHRRTWHFNDIEWFVEDDISGNENYVVSRYHLHPEIQIRKFGNRYIFSKKGVSLAECTFSAFVEVEICNTTYHDEFGISKPNKCIQTKSFSPCKFEIIIKIL